jgi:demethylmenaquinone methyltransferase / 2-methoxy-6-polyprenyl-1,4-benzoquinol methylase
VKDATVVMESSVGVDPEITRLYDRAAKRYDRLNNLISFGTSNWYRRRTILSLDLPSDGTLVDVGSGTGSLAVAAQRYLPDSPSIVAVDPSPEMRAMASRAGVRDVRAGSFGSIPVEDASMDAMVSGYAIRYAVDLAEAFAEARRVLRSGGRLVLLEMVVPRSPAKRRILRFMVQGLGARFFSLVCGSRAAGDLMRHFWDSISSFESPELVVELLENSGFVDVKYRYIGGLLGEFRAQVPVE